MKKILFLFYALLSIFSFAQNDVINYLSTKTVTSTGTNNLTSTTFDVAAGYNRMLIITFNIERQNSGNNGDNYAQPTLLSTNGGTNASYLDVKISDPTITNVAPEKTYSWLFLTNSSSTTATVTTSSLSSSNITYYYLVTGNAQKTITIDWSSILPPKSAGDELLVNITAFKNVAPSGLHRYGYDNNSSPNTKSTINSATSSFGYTATTPVGRTYADRVFFGNGFSADQRGFTINTTTIPWITVENNILANTNGNFSTLHPILNTTELSGISNTFSYVTNRSTAPSYELTRSNQNAINAFVTTSFLLEPLAKPSISGTIFDDSQASQPGSNAGVGYINLLDKDNKILASTAINSNGTYSFPSGLIIETFEYSLQLSKTPGVVGLTSNTATVNDGWRVSREQATNGTIGVLDGMIKFVAGNINIVNNNFGINKAAIVAVMDIYNDMTITNITGGTVKDTNLPNTPIASILSNDGINGSAPAPANDVTITYTSPTPNISINNNGNVIVTPGVPAGSYRLDYTICLKSLLTSCSSATVTIQVYNDQDADGIIDIKDLDADNDGILNENENYLTTSYNTNYYSSWVNNQIIWTDNSKSEIFTTTINRTNAASNYVSGPNSTYKIRPAIGDKITYTFSQSVSNLTYFIEDLDALEKVYINMYDQNGNRIPSLLGANTTLLKTTEDVADPNPNIPSATQHKTSTDSNYELIIESVIDNTATTKTNSVFIRLSGIDVSKVEITYLGTKDAPDYHLYGFNATFDTDNDGTADWLDVDSDNDNCADALEGSELLKREQVHALNLPSTDPNYNYRGQIKVIYNGITPGTPSQIISQATWNLGVPQLVNRARNNYHSITNPSDLAGVADRADGTAEEGQGVGSSNNSALKSAVCSICYKPAKTTGTALPTTVGISTIGQDTDWPQNRNGAFIAIESKTKGLVLPRMTSLQMSAIPQPQIGMIIFNTDNNCIKMYINNSFGVPAWSNCLEEPTCEDPL